jgi:plastocyanin
MRSICLLAAVCITASACSGDGGDPPTGGNPPAEGDITVGNHFFSPDELDVAAGATVVWTWAAGAVTHNVTFDGGPVSDNQASGSFTRTFSAPGTYPYHCSIHGASVMSGVVSVAQAGTDGRGTVDY